MDKLTAIKIKYDDGTYSDEIPVSVLSENVEWDNTHTLVDVLGSIDVDVTGTIQDQINQLFNEKVSAIQLQNYVASQLSTDVTTWLKQNVNPVGSAIVVDSSLTINGAAADANMTGTVKNAVMQVSELCGGDLLYGITYENKVFSKGPLDIKDNNNFVITPFLPVVPHKKYLVNVPSGFVWCAFTTYSTTDVNNKKFINWSSNNSFETEMPYIRLCFSTVEYNKPIDASTFISNVFYNIEKNNFDNYIDVTDDNWVKNSAENYENNYIGFDKSNKYYIYVPERTEVIVRYISFDGKDKGSSYPLRKSDYLNLNDVSNIFVKMKLEQRFYGNFEKITSEVRPKLFITNVIDKYVIDDNLTLLFDMASGGYVNTENGTITTTTDKYWGITDFIKIPSNAKIILNNLRYTDGLPFGYAIYDQNYNFLRGGQSNSIEVQDGDYFFVGCDGNNSGTHTNRTICFVKNGSEYCDKTMAFSGDSITFGYDDLNNGQQLDNTWVNQIGNNVGVKRIINYGVSSASLMDVKGTAQAVITAYEGFSNDVDIIGFMIGINDCYRNTNGEADKYVFGTINDNTKDTFLGCMNLLCQGAVKKWKPKDGKKVFFLTYAQPDLISVRDNPVTYKNFSGWKAWIEAIKDVCSKYAIPVCDTYNNLGIVASQDNDADYWMKYNSGQHSVHFKQLGANVFASYVSKWIKSNL